MEIYTIGFTQRTAETFFEALKAARITRLIDVRLNNVSQLAGYSKKDDLRYFVRTICDADYVHEQTLAPTADMLKAYRAGNMSWSDYAAAYNALLEQRDVAGMLNPDIFEGRPVLLCSERRADWCHRRLAAEYLRARWSAVEVVHL